MSVQPQPQPQPQAPAARRFDRLALGAPQASAGEQQLLARQPVLQAALAAWLQAPAACGAAVLQGGGGTQPPDAWAQAWARAVDGSHRLQELGRWAGLWWRLQVALDDRRTVPRAEGPWDAGWASASAPGRDHLARHWWPRRHTLLLASSGQADALAPVWAQLQARGAGQGRRLRWLWLQAEGGPAAPAVDGPVLRLG